MREKPATSKEASTFFCSAGASPTARKLKKHIDPASQSIGYPCTHNMKKQSQANIWGEMVILNFFRNFVFFHVNWGQFSICYRLNYIF